MQYDGLNFKYNLFNDINYVRSKFGCRWDTNAGHEAEFLNHETRQVDKVIGFDLYGFTDYFIYGISLSGSCYIAHSHDITPSWETSAFPLFKIDMLLRYTGNSPKDTTLTSRLLWQLETDEGNNWNVNAYQDIDVIIDGQWHTYQKDLRTNPTYVGSCRNFTFYPFIDGFSGIEVLIRRIVFGSNTNFRCSSPNGCSYFNLYEHPCPGAGERAYATTAFTKISYTITSDQCKLGVSIDGSDIYYITLPTRTNATGYTIARDITRQLSQVGVGGFLFAECTYEEDRGALKIYSGTIGQGSVQIHSSPEFDAAVTLGFDNYTTFNGNATASNYESRYYRLTPIQVYEMLEAKNSAVNFDPIKPAIEMGVPEVFSIQPMEYWEPCLIPSVIYVDLLSRAEQEGKINNIKINAKLDSSQPTGKILLLRPVSSSSFKIIYIKQFSATDNLASYITTQFQLRVDWNVMPGDCFGYSGFKPAVGSSRSLTSHLDTLPAAHINLLDTNMKENDIIDYDISDQNMEGFECFLTYGYSDAIVRRIGLECVMTKPHNVEAFILGANEVSNDVFINLTSLSGCYTTLSVQKQADAVYNPCPQPLFIPNIGTNYFYLAFNFSRLNNYKIDNIVMEPMSKYNVRSFCWERYVESGYWSFYKWGNPYPYSTPAKSTGSSFPWIRLDDPYQVIIDNNIDETTNLYLSSNYVTDSLSDYFPGLNKQQVQARSSAGSSLGWHKLQTFYTDLEARQLRLYCWYALTGDFFDIQLNVKVPKSAAILNCVHSKIYLTSPTFSTTTYDVVDIQGESYTSSRITAQTESGLTFDVELTPADLSGQYFGTIGSLISMVDLEIEGLPVELDSLFLFGQNSAVYMRNVNDSPITEMKESDWNLPQPQQEARYGPAVSYKIFNDTTVSANLVMDLVRHIDFSIGRCYSSDLMTQHSLDFPDSGVAPILLTKPDFSYNKNDGFNWMSRIYTVEPLDLSSGRWYCATTRTSYYQYIETDWSLPENYGWNESSHNDWYAFGLSRCRDFALTTSGFYMTVSGSVLTDNWRQPTYFKSLSDNSSFKIEVGIAQQLNAFPGTESFAGIVLWDIEDDTKHINIGRSAGNYVSFAPGDYVCYGLFETEHRINISNPLYMLYLRMIRDTNSVILQYRLPWEGWTTLGTYDINDWGKQLRVGLFGGAITLPNWPAANTRIQFSMFDYQDGDSSVHTDFYDLGSFNFLTNPATGFRPYSWSASNPLNASKFVTITSDLDLELERSFIFKPDYFGTSESPALMHPYVPSQWSLSFDLISPSIYHSDPGSQEAGFAVSSIDGVSWIKLVLQSSGTLCFSTSLSYSFHSAQIITLDSFNAESTVTFNYKYSDNGIPVIEYSTDGINFTKLVPTIMLAYPETYYLGYFMLSAGGYKTKAHFSNIQAKIDMCSSITKLAYYFPITQKILRTYSSCSTITFDHFISAGSPDPNNPGFTALQSPISCDLQWTFFNNTTLTGVVDLSCVRFIPDIIRGAPATYTEIDRNSFYTSCGAIEYPPSIFQDISKATIKGIPRDTYPVLLVDFENIKEIGRFKVAASNDMGTFSSSNTDDPSQIIWDKTILGTCGYTNRQCKLSDGHSCQAPTTYYDNLTLIKDSSNFYRAFAPGNCNGISTTIGTMFQECPLYYVGSKRWWLLIADPSNLYDTTSNKWIIYPVSQHPYGRDLSLTAESKWWSTTSGWCTQNNDAIDYFYPGGDYEEASINSAGCNLFRFNRDSNWTFEDSLIFDLRVDNPSNLDTVSIFLGASKAQCYGFTIPADSIRTEWIRFELPFGNTDFYSANTDVISLGTATSEPTLVKTDKEYYLFADFPDSPQPYYNIGYIGVGALGGPAIISFKSFGHKRARFQDKGLFLGTLESLYFPQIPLTIKRGTISFHWKPSVAANEYPSDPRILNHSLFSFGSAACTIALIYQYYRNNLLCWTLYINGNKSQEVQTFTYNPIHPGIDIVCSWDAGTLTGRSENIIIWMNGEEVMSLKTNIFNEMETTVSDLIFGRGSLSNEVIVGGDLCGYAWFSNISLYKDSVGSTTSISKDRFNPEELFEVSEDKTTWHSIEAGNLPFVIYGIPPNIETEIFVRNKQLPPEGMNRCIQRTAFMEIKWELNT